MSWLEARPKVVVLNSVLACSQTSIIVYVSAEEENEALVRTPTPRTLLKLIYDCKMPDRLFTSFTSNIYTLSIFNS